MLDLRADILWTEIADGSAFLSAVLDAVPTGRDRVRFAFASPEATVDQLVRLALLAPNLDELARRVEAAELQATPPTFFVRFQPIASLSTEGIVGFEALMRAEAGGRHLDAEELIRRAGDGGWLQELDTMGRRLALQGVGPWLGQGLLFLNVMAPDGRFDLDAVRETLAAAAEVGLEPDQLVFETAERNRFDDLDEVSEQVAEMRHLGVRIAVDDVGDGFSSLKVVAAFAPDIVKITGELVAGLPSSAAESVIRAIVAMAHATNTWVVAENIETAEQARRLRDLGVDWGQGHLLGVPAARLAS